MYPDLVYQLALTMVPQIGPVQARLLLQHCDIAEIFHAKKSFLEKIEGIGPARARSIRKFNGFALAEKECAFMEKHQVQPLFLTDEHYPRRLLHCNDAPILIFLKGKANLNPSRIVSVVGTRSHTEYGKWITEKIVGELAGWDATIVSGLAYGIDAVAHRQAISSGAVTIGVLAHGLTHLYPPDHRARARDMLAGGGGLLTEFWSTAKPDKHNFPIRNRIVAGMADATIVIETDFKGGSMITAELAAGYNRDVLAVPGRINDRKSAGCNQLLHQQKATIIAQPSDIGTLLGWQRPAGKDKQHVQPSLFPELTEKEQTIVNLLRQQPILAIDEINLQSGYSPGTVAALVLALELKNVVLSLPGKMYRLV